MTWLAEAPTCTKTHLPCAFLAAALLRPLVPRHVAAGAAGEKLSESNAADVRELCNTLLSAYLVQLLETGRLHADPHPGEGADWRVASIAPLPLPA